MLFILVPETLLKGFFHHLLIHLNVFHLVQMRSCFFMGQLQHVRLVKPAEHLRPNLRLLLSRPEAFVKSHVKLIKISFTFYQDHPGNVIKLCQGASTQPFIQSLLQRQKLTQRDVQTFSAQIFKKFRKHASPQSRKARLIHHIPFSRSRNVTS